MQGSPNLANSGKETYRRALAVTATRAGLQDGVQYLYTLNLACPQDLWEDLEPVFKQVRTTASNHPRVRSTALIMHTRIVECCLCRICVE